MAETCGLVVTPSGAATEVGCVKGERAWVTGVDGGVGGHCHEESDTSEVMAGSGHGGDRGLTGSDVRGAATWWMHRVKTDAGPRRGAEGTDGPRAGS